MDIPKLVICVMSVLLLLQETASDCPEVASTVGQNFMFAVPSKQIASYDYIFVHITPVSNSPARVRITSPFFNYDQFFTVENGTYFRLNETLVQVDSGLQVKGIEVSSDVNISVVVIAYFGYFNTEAFLVLPVTALSTRYVGASYQPVVDKNNSVLVVGVESNTEVTIKYRTAGQKSFSIQNVTLQKFETFQHQDNYDLTGTVVISNKPVAVISGSYRSDIPVGNIEGYKNYLVEQMIPTKYWTHTFIVPPIYPSNNYIVKILVDINNTDIQCYNSSSHFSVFLDQGSIYEIMFGTDPTVIQASNPISVFQYPSDDGNTKGVPFMTTVQGVSQFISSYKFYTSYLYDLNRTTVLTIPRNILSGLQLDGKNISWRDAKIVPVPKPMDDYITMFINVSSNSTHNLQHINGNSFGASTYVRIQGLYGTLGYGYPLQLSFSECDEPRPTSPPITATTATTNSPATTNSRILDHNGNGTWCMKCDNMLHLQYCDTVTRCGSEHDVCYVQAYTRSEGNLAYRSGCIEKSKCQNHGGNVHCHQCCDGNFCNTAGCGDPGLSALDTRGPLCFDCTHKGEEDICQTLQLCEQGQVCKVEKDKWGSSFHYTMGCVAKTECSSKRSFHGLQSRNVIACSQCCDSDFCNQNCTSQHNPAIIG